MMNYKDGIITTPDLPFNEKSGGVGFMLYQGLKEHGDRVALINSRNDELLTHTDLLERSVSTALALQKRGFKQEDLVGLCSNKENLNANVPIIAGQFLGCVTFSVDPGMSIAELSELFQQVPPTIIFVIDDAKQKIQKALEMCKVTTEIISFGKEFEDEFLKFVSTDFQPVFIENLNETCMIQFSSGSTSAPKPICLNHYFFMGLVVPIPRPRAEPSQEKFANHEIGYVSLRFANWYWLSASMEMFDFIWTGKCRLMQDRFNADQVWNTVAKYKVADILIMLVDCIEIVESKKFPKNLDVSCLKTIYSGGEVLRKEYIEGLRKFLPGVDIFSVYAMTECGVVTYPYRKDFIITKPESCGLPIPGLHYKVIDVETGKVCGPNQPGELYLKGKRLFNGLYNQDITQCFDDEGFFKTGDLVYYDEDFSFFIVDRLKAVLKWNCTLIYPSHIEKVLLSHPAVSDAIVIGLPHKTEIQRPFGVVILKDNVDNVTEEDLVKYVEERVEDPKRLRGGLMFVKEFPVTITGKISRPKIKKMVLDKLNH